MYMFSPHKRPGLYKGYPFNCHRGRTIVAIHSSSHLLPHRGVVGGLSRKLGDGYKVYTVAKGGKKWDNHISSDFHEINKQAGGLPVLHVILLGDNDVRGTPVTEGVNPSIQRFGEFIKNYKDPSFHYNVFVNGILPFPMHEQRDSRELIENYSRYTMGMYRLIKCSPRIQFVPMRESVMDFCKENRVMASMLFRRDNVHLTRLGEEFLIDHLFRQIVMYHAAKGSCVSPNDLVFFKTTASRHRTKEENSIVLRKELEVESVLTKNF